jgi:hypothetical protein
MNESLMYGSEDQDGKRFPPLSSTSWEDNSRNVSGEIDLCLGGETPLSKSARGKRKSKGVSL